LWRINYEQGHSRCELQVQGMLGKD
jgi:hypothetical protein